MDGWGSHYWGSLKFSLDITDCQQETRTQQHKFYSFSPWHFAEIFSCEEKPTFVVLLFSAASDTWLFFSTRWNNLKQMILESSHWNFSYCSTGSPIVTVGYVDANSLIIHVLQLGWFVGFGAVWCKKISFTTGGVSLLHVKIHRVHLSIPKAPAFGLAWLISQRTLWRKNVRFRSDREKKSMEESMWNTLETNRQVGWMAKVLITRPSACIIYHCNWGFPTITSHHSTMRCTWTERSIAGLGRSDFFWKVNYGLINGITSGWCFKVRKKY